MLELAADERKIICSSSNFAYTRRFCQFSYTFQNDNFIFVHYCATKWSQRKIGLLCGSVKDERHIFVPAVTTTESSHRTILCADRFPAKGDRWCTYVPGAQIIISASPTYLSITYHSKRSIWCHKDPISQRVIIFPITIPSDVVCQVTRYQEHRVYAPQIQDCIKISDEKYIYVETGSWSSIRRIGFPITTYDNKNCMVQRYQQVLCSSTQTKYGLSSVYSERYMDVCVGYNFSDRSILMLGSPYCERAITLNYSVFDDKHIALVVESVHCLYDFQIVQARVEPSERHCVFLPIIYNSERHVFMETRDIYITKKPRTSPDQLSLYMFDDENRQLYFSNEREMELHANDIKKQQISTDTVRTKHTLRQNEKLDSDAHRIATTMTVSSVDNKGAAVFNGAADQKQMLIASTCLNLNISII